MDWPANPFWDYALALYRRIGVEHACLELQNRHDLDVNLVLLCCWLGSRGIEAQRDWLARVAAITGVWQGKVVRPLRAVRSSIKAQLAEPATDGITARWPQLSAGLRQRVLALEIDGERLEQLLLADLAAELPVTATPGVAPASRNLRHYWRFVVPDRQALETLLGAAFPEAPVDEIARGLDWLERQGPQGWRARLARSADPCRIPDASLQRRRSGRPER
jgi:uncharacterized protein (TIGR02444 family)